MNDAIIYYRSRPSEPEASRSAMQLQREAVRAEVEMGRLRVVGEFVEEDGASDQVLRQRREAFWRAVEADDPLPKERADEETRPAYVAACRAARAHGSACLVIVSHAAIGSGEVFEVPEVDPGFRPLHVMLSTASVPTPHEIPVPTGAPGVPCLYAHVRPRQLETLIYLCNDGAEPLSEVTVGLDSITMLDFLMQEPEQRPAEAPAVELQWAVLPAGRAVLIGSLSHVMWDFVDRYHLAWNDELGRRWTGEVDSFGLSAEEIRQDPLAAWKPVRLKVLAVRPECAASGRFP